MRQVDYGAYRTDCIWTTIVLSAWNGFVTASDMFGMRRVDCGASLTVTECTGTITVRATNDFGAFQAVTDCTVITAVNAGRNGYGADGHGFNAGRVDCRLHRAMTDCTYCAVTDWIGTTIDRDGSTGFRAVIDGFGFSAVDNG